MSELCNIVPEPSVRVYIPEHKKYRLRLQFDHSKVQEFDFKDKKSEKVRPEHILFECDKDDWMQARHCLWWYDEVRKVPVNAVGITFTEYVGIKGSRLTSHTEKYNFCRYCYGN